MSVDLAERAALLTLCHSSAGECDSVAELWAHGPAAEPPGHAPVLIRTLHVRSSPSRFGDSGEPEFRARTVLVPWVRCTAALPARPEVSAERNPAPHSAAGSPVRSRCLCTESTRGSMCT